VSKLDADALTARIAGLIGAASADQDHFGIAVSGGADSLALMLLAHEAFGPRMAAASVDHRLRPEAADECRFVAALCAERGIRHSILTPSAPPEPPSQASARALRYRLLFEWMAETGINWLLTAHHADDQVETLMMRLNRGSGVAGLAGIRVRNGQVLRPLLNWPQSALRAVVERAGIMPVADPSNSDMRFDRVQVRRALAGQDWIDPISIAASAGHLADAETALAWTAARLMVERTQAGQDGMILDTSDLPSELRQRLIRQCIETIGQRAVRGGEVARLINNIADGGIATLGGAMVSVAAAEGHLWRICTAPARSK
jgi:tRNA(Ile)-lysidine synthase